MTAYDSRLFGHCAAGCWNKKSISRLSRFKNENYKKFLTSSADDDCDYITRYFYCKLTSRSSRRANCKVRLSSFISSNLPF
eukprot:scaffold3644_cov199-Chaetoceros_neogracile.AAC.2